MFLLTAKIALAVLMRRPMPNMLLARKPPLLHIIIIIIINNNDYEKYFLVSLCS